MSDILNFLKNSLKDTCVVLENYHGVRGLAVYDEEVGEITLQLSSLQCKHLNNSLEVETLPEKKCRICGEPRKIEKFGNCSTSRDGKKNVCDSCEHERYLDRQKDPKAYAGRIYGRINQKNAALHGCVEVSREDFKNYLAQDSEFLRIFEVWRDSGCDTKKTPHICRQDRKKPLTLNNIRVTQGYKQS